MVRAGAQLHVFIFHVLFHAKRQTNLRIYRNIRLPETQIMGFYSTCPGQPWSWPTFGGVAMPTFTGSPSLIPTRLWVGSGEVTWCYFDPARDIMIMISGAAGDTGRCISKLVLHILHIILHIIKLHIGTLEIFVKTIKLHTLHIELHIWILVLFCIFRI